MITTSCLSKGCLFERLAHVLHNRSPLGQVLTVLCLLSLGLHEKDYRNHLAFFLRIDTKATVLHRIVLCVWHVNQGREAKRGWSLRACPFMCEIVFPLEPFVMLCDLHRTRTN